MISQIYNVERLLPFERDFFFWINDYNNDFWDQFMVIYTDRYTWYPLIIILFLALSYKRPWQFVLLLIFSAVVLGLMCDYFAAEFIKPFFARYRPSHHPDFKDLVHIVNDRRGGRYGFISNHASNGAAIAVFTSLLFKWRYYTLVIFAWALISIYSRVYLGVHFITDIIGGFIWGSLSAVLVYFIFQIFQKRISAFKNNNITALDPTHKRASLVILGFFLTLIIVFLMAAFRHYAR